MLHLAQKPLHERTTISQLDAVGRVMGLKAELNLSREGFDKMLGRVWHHAIGEAHFADELVRGRETPSYA